MLKIGQLEGALRDCQERLRFERERRDKAQLTEEIERLGIAMREMRQHEWETQQRLSALLYAKGYATSANPVSPVALKHNRHSYEVQCIEQAMVATNGNAQEAAKLLGISVATLYRRVPNARHAWKMAQREKQ